MPLRRFPFRRKTARIQHCLLALTLIVSLSYSACGADNGVPGNASSTMPTEQATQQANSMKINITVGEQVVIATLIDSKTTQDFIALLPLTLTLEDYASTEKISDLPERLSTEDAPAGSDPAVGDIAYYAPWGNLALFYRDFGYADGLVILGKIEEGIEVFSEPGSVAVIIELVQ